MYHFLVAYNLNVFCISGSLSKADSNDEMVNKFELLNRSYNIIARIFERTTNASFFSTGTYHHHQIPTRALKISSYQPVTSSALTYKTSAISGYAAPSNKLLTNCKIYNEV